MMVELKSIFRYVSLCNVIFQDDGYKKVTILVTVGVYRARRKKWYSLPPGPPLHIQGAMKGVAMKRLSQDKRSRCRRFYSQRSSINVFTLIRDALSTALIILFAVLSGMFEFHSWKLWLGNSSLKTLLITFSASSMSLTIRELTRQVAITVLFLMLFFFLF